MNKKNNDGEKKLFYLFVVCLTLSIIIVGATFAYFAVRIRDNENVRGVTDSSGFSLSITKVTSLDLTYGLIPMHNIEAPYAAEQLCKDDNERIGCQIYKITLGVNNDDVLFVDGFIYTDVIDGIETRFTRVYPDTKSYTDEKTGENVSDNVFKTSYTKNEMLDSNFVESDHIKDGKAVNANNRVLNKIDDANCLVADNLQVGGSAGNNVDIYVMIWIWDDGTNQDFIQGNELVYTGTVTFVTASGNEIKATFD